MARSRPFATYYNTATHPRGGEKHYSRVGRASTLHNAVLAATKRVLNLDYEQADIYDAMGRHRVRTGRRRDVVIASIKVVQLRRAV